MCRASMAPPAGPDSTSRIECSIAVSTVVTPPLDIIIINGQTKPSSINPCRKRVRYLAISGWM